MRGKGFNAKPFSYSSFNELMLFAKILLVFYVGLALASCQRATPPPVELFKPLFDSVPAKVPVVPLIAEASGIADSKLNAGYLWVEEDSGNPPQLTLLQHNGIVKKTVYIKGATNRDWEDMCISGNDIYIAETGDNNAMYPDYAFYKFPEPSLSVDTVRSFETIRFRYPDGSHDAEAFLVEPTTANIYIITKRDVASRLYKLTAPFSGGGVYTASLVGQLNYNGVVSAAISNDAKEIVIKTYFGLNYYQKNATDLIEATLQKISPIAIPYLAEPQGEAVCFSAVGDGYYTLSEIGSATYQHLYFYKRN